MLKILITVALVLILTTSIYSQAADAKFGGAFRGGGGIGKSFSSNSVPLGAGTGKTFTTGPSGKVTPQETPKQTTPPSSSGSGGSTGPQSNFQGQGGPQSQFQQQPRSGFFGGGFGGGGMGGLGGFGNMLVSSIMGNIIGQALFGWMFPHPTAPVPVSAPAPAPAPTTTHSPAHTGINSTTANNPTQQFPYQAQQFNSTQIK